MIMLQLTNGKKYLQVIVCIYFSESKGINPAQDVTDWLVCVCVYTNIYNNMWIHYSDAASLCPTQM